MWHQPTETGHFIQSGVCVCVSKQDEKEISFTKTGSNQSSVKKKNSKKNRQSCANRAYTYLEMWWLEPALWTLHTQEEDKYRIQKKC